MLPAVHKLYIPGPHHMVLREAAVSLMVSCRFSGHFIEVGYTVNVMLDENHPGTDCFSEFSHIRKTYILLFSTF